MAIDQIELAIQSFRPESGDVLVFRTPGLLSHRTMENIRASVARVLPGVKAMVLEEGMTLDVLRNDDGPLPWGVGGG